MTKTTGNSDIDIHGNQNVTITSDVHGNVTVNYGGRDVRGEELGYLDGLIERYQFWAEKYTPLAGIAEVRAAAKEGPRLDLPMLFMPTGFEKLEEHGFGMERRTERVPVDDLRAAVARYKRLVLLGEPGSGKTTTLWRLAYDYAVAAKDDPHAPMPLLVPLGGYTGPESALTYAQNHLEELGPYLPAYLRSQRVILLLDALNEMPQSGYKERVGRIQTLLDTYPGMQAIVTCRALDYVETLRLEKLEVKPLDLNRQQEYLRRYLGETEGEKLFQQMGGTSLTRRRRPWQDDQTPPLIALGRNPFMLVMTAQVYATRGGILPQNRGRLFAAFVDTLLGREEKRCDPTTWPGADALRLAMSRLAYAMQETGERGTAVEADWAKKQMAQPDVDADRIAYLCASATLLDTSNSQVRFVHQLVQEYFAALALVDRLQRGDNLRRYWRMDWARPSGWEETFVLLAGMLPDMTPLIERMLPVNPALTARCVAESGGEQPGDGTIRQVQETLVGIATSRQAQVAQRNAAGDALNYVGDPRRGVGVRDDGVPGIALCEVPARTFVIGNTRETDPDTNYGEMPQRRLLLERFLISKYLITNAQYEAFVADGGYTVKWCECWTESGWRWKGKRAAPDRAGGVYDLPNHPVVAVTWYEAVAFSHWLGKRLGWSVRLPSEAQWERAARHTDGRKYPWNGKLTVDHVNCQETYIKSTTAVGIFPKGAAECGALDMIGNVWEWCLTKWSTEFRTCSNDDQEGAEFRVFRGGSYESRAGFVRCSERRGCAPQNRGRYLGFRVVVASP